MLVDDSVVARSIFQRMLEPHAAFEVVAVAHTADQALEKLATIGVDIILLDVDMPGTDGLTALPRLIEASGARVLVISSSCDVGGAAAVRAMTLGAADTLPKPGAGSFGGRFADVLAETLLRIGHAPNPALPDTVAIRVEPLAPVQRPLPLRPPVAGPIGCIAIGASTGGLHALSAFFRALPLEVAVPILITQHLPASFMPYFATQIADIAGRPARVAADGDRLDGGMMLIAPGDAHLGLMRSGVVVRVVLDRAPAASGCLPSVDPMFDAVAATYGPGGVGVVLSGMGRDGALAAPRLCEAGGEVLAQDMATSAVWGMPGAVAVAGDTAGVMEPAAIARRIARRHAAAHRVPLRDAVQWR
ncbi:response regulator [Sphingomonas sp. XMGL2]|uniref:Response regulator n=2 Tax=Sphingomonas quercus TaxID=2842451 RepID=A0ABS6BJB2_9SPHN|nr:response regulator [Sphingomonas quercus]